MLRADRNAATLAGLICSAATIKGKSGKVLTAADFDIFNRNDEPQGELTVESVMAVLGGKVSG